LAETSRHEEVSGVRHRVSGKRYSVFGVGIPVGTLAQRVSGSMAREITVGETRRWVVSGEWGAEHPRNRCSRWRKTL
jgi:hypothetical protein